MNSLPVQRFDPSGAAAEPLVHPLRWPAAQNPLSQSAVPYPSFTPWQGAAVQTLAVGWDAARSLRRGAHRPGPANATGRFAESVVVVAITVGGALAAASVIEKAFRVLDAAVHDYYGTRSTRRGAEGNVLHGTAANRTGAR